MPRQKGIIKLDGTIGDITFYRTKDGYMAKEKLRVPPGRILNDPRFARTRENMAEIGRACNEITPSTSKPMTSILWRVI